MTRPPITETESQLRALADAGRLEILEIVARGGAHGVRAYEVVRKMTGLFGQSTVSHHMRVLTEAGFVFRRNGPAAPGGPQVFYVANPAMVNAVLDRVREIVR